MRYMADRRVGDSSPVLTVFDIGPKQSETPEGYLLCEEVPIARTGIQQYLNAELEPDAEGGKDGIIHVERLAADVFHPDTIASFEGKSVTIEHPDEMLNPDNVHEHEVGILLNVRQGAGAQTDYLLADLLIKRKDAIAAVRAGKRQVSCGYGSDYMSLAPGRARQHNITGNHVAIVPKGRCGPSCAIGDEDMVNKKVDEKMVKKSAMKTFMDGLKSLVATADAEFANGEEGELTFDENLPSKSGMESSSSVGGDTHVHLHMGPNDSTTIAPTTDKKMKDKKSKDDEGTAEEMETEDAEPDEEEDKKTKDSFMDAMSKAYDAEMKKVKDKKPAADKKMKDAKAKDAEPDDDKDDKETKDADVEEEGEAESEGSVESADAEPDDKDDKETKDKKMKDKKGTKDSAPLKDDFQVLKSDVEILSPGLKLPTFDSAAPQKATVDSMCLLRRRSLAASAKTEEGNEVLTMLNSGKPLDLKTLTCDSAAVFFNNAVAFARDRNVQVGGLKRGRSTADTKTAPASNADFNKRTADFYDNQRPKSTTQK